VHPEEGAKFTREEMQAVTTKLAGPHQGLTLVPISAQLELFCPPYNPT